MLPSFEKYKQDFQKVFSSPKSLQVAGAVICLIIIFYSMRSKTSTIPAPKIEPLKWESKAQLASLDNTLEIDFKNDINNNLHTKLRDKDIEIERLHAAHNASEKKIEMLEKTSKQIMDNLNTISKRNYVERNLGISGPETSSQVVVKKLNVREIESQATRRVSNYIPAGTFLKAKILGGVDVSTNPSAKNNPQPMLLHVTDWANLPSLVSQNIEHCRITAHAWGDLSSERAYARTENLSCVKKNGDVLDTKIQAFIVDETAKNGIRGDVVARHEGSMITQAFLSKFIGSIGGSLSDYSDNFIASQEDISWKDASRTSGLNAAGKGIKGAGDTLERYFVERLNELSPVIQIFADKDVHVVLTKGVDLVDGTSNKGVTYEIS